MAEIPHLRFPLTLAGTRLATVTQDSPEHVRQRLQCILRTPVGFRDDYPDLGLARQELRRGGPDLEEIRRQIETYEPRVNLDTDDVDVSFNDDGSLADVTVRLRV